MRLEAERLSSASFGVTLLHCIGRVYSRQADMYLGGLIGKLRIEPALLHSCGGVGEQT
jgi:hypothetical protein